MNRLPILVLICLGFCGCSSYRNVSIAERERLTPEERIYKIELTSGEFVEFEGDPLGFAMLKPGGIERLLADGAVVTIPVASVKRIYTKETTFLSTTGGIILISAVGAVLLFVALGTISFPGM
jgi:hypothetical protein